ncbi:hypothetical protein Ciccas_013332 [Cichlidogyrus casuarinus]|uniref:Uncharacterized protein n=1 Tax=Cichlidogyrus casuarinus TaxID=1844966 RepID=A0ABD2PNW9_9PLAT
MLDPVAEEHIYRSDAISVQLSAVDPITRQYERFLQDLEIRFSVHTRRQEFDNLVTSNSVLHAQLQHFDTLHFLRIRAPPVEDALSEDCAKRNRILFLLLPSCRSKCWSTFPPLEFARVESSLKSVT